MEAESSLPHLTPPVFDGENYQLWAVRMETYLEALDLWEAVEEYYEVHPLPNNPTMAQIKVHKERKTMKSKAKASLFAAVSTTIFTRIMDFELQKMKESETVKEYSDRLLGIVNKVRLLGTEFPDSRVVENFFVTVPERYEASITTLENTKDLSKITLAELLNALQAQEQRRFMRQDRKVEGALLVKHQDAGKNKKNGYKKNQVSSSENTASNQLQNKGGNFKRNYPPCQYCGRKGHPSFKCWKRPDAKCSKCNQLGHEAVICKRKFQKLEADAQVADQDKEDLMFVATCFSTRSSSECWLIDSGCTNHMTYDRTIFKELKPTGITKIPGVAASATHIATAKAAAKDQAGLFSTAVQSSRHQQLEGHDHQLKCDGHELMIIIQD
ncbi:hypothetical protein JRO89_XS01G0120000 [Xanthoceras sorbifolium]|uniref:CCHC-type domain-containing protein n=1 Tax=Xanthoceras sorbifolium TaxID=99658 RepID=A0ABQ8IJ61_9ROSI|nr:hypothetical protein JRO89_XS01G0120000 [Xanthoceras sorbifolium]